MAKTIIKRGGAPTRAEKIQNATARRSEKWHALMLAGGWTKESGGHGQYVHTSGILIDKDIAGALFAKGRAFNETGARVLKMYCEKLGAGDGRRGAIDVRTWERWAVQMIDRDELPASDALAAWAGIDLDTKKFNKVLDEWWAAVQASGLTEQKVLAAVEAKL